MESLQHYSFRFIAIVFFYSFSTPESLSQPINADAHYNLSISKIQTKLDSNGRSEAIRLLDSVAARLITESDSILLTVGFSIAFNYRKVHRYKSARAITESLADAAERKKDSVNWSRALYYSGLSNKKIGLYNRALKKLYQGLSISEAQNDVKRKCLILIQIGSVKKAQGSIEESCEVFNEALVISYQLNEEGLSASILNNIGSAFKSLGHHNKAKEHFLKAIEINKRIGNQLQLSHNYNNLANIYEETGNLSRALLYQEKSINLKKRLKDEPSLAMSYANMAIIYKKLDSLQKAQEFCDKAFKLANKYSNAKATEAAYTQLISIAAAKKNFEKAYRLQKALGKFNDSISLRDQDALLDEFDAQVNRQELILENEILKRGIREHEAILYEKNAFLVLFGVFILVLIIIVSLYFISVRSALSASALNTELQTRNDSLDKRLKAKATRLKELESKHKILESKTTIMTVGVNQGIQRSAESLLSSAILTNNGFEQSNLHLFIASKINRRINNIHDLQSLEHDQLALNHQAFSLVECMRKLNREFNILLTTKDIELTIDLPKDLPDLVSDGYRIEQILASLIEAAIFYTKEGFINIDIHVEQSMSDSSLIKVAIKTSGQSVSPNIVRKVFSQSIYDASLIDDSNNSDEGDVLFSLYSANQLLNYMGVHFEIPNKNMSDNLFLIEMTLPRLS
jgi:tetratricopeptide (TPR) repeat protein